MKLTKKISSVAAGLLITSSLFAGNVENALIQKGSYDIAGEFASYDFNSDGKIDPSDWTFKTSDGTVYQLLGDTSDANIAQNGVFGWKQLSNFTASAPAFYMAYLAEDVDGDGTKKFDWVVIQASTGSTWKLKGQDATTKAFSYSDQLALKTTVNSATKKINFASNATASTTTISAKTETITGDITSNTTWSADTVYTLDGKIKVKNGAKLTIQAGTKILGRSTAYVVVTKGSTIEAVGTASSPIIFDSEDHYFGATAAAGQWGGLTVLGGAQTNAAGLAYEVDEADADFAFGSVTTEANTASSGTLKYVEIHNSGFAVAVDKEVNGLSLAGVGSGTIIENIKIVNSGDDGIELWGGTVNLTNISITGALDDSFDVDNGYNGTVKNLTVVQTLPAAGGMEMTNSGDSSIVRTNPTFDGFTITTSSSQKKEGGIYLKDDGVTGTFKNGTIIHNGADGALHSKKELVVSPIFSNVKITGSSTSKYTGPAAAKLQAAFEAQ